MLEPVPFKVVSAEEVDQAPAGAYPISLYGGPSGGGGAAPDTGFVNLELPDDPDISESVSEVLIRRAGNMVHLQGTLLFIGGRVFDGNGISVTRGIPEGFIPETKAASLTFPTQFWTSLAPGEPIIAGVAGFVSVNTGDETIYEVVAYGVPTGTEMQLIAYSGQWFTDDPFPEIGSNT